MKKTLGALVLTLSSLALAAGCATSTPPSKPTPQQPDAGETWSKAAPSELPRRPANATGVETARLAE